MALKRSDSSLFLRTPSLAVRTVFFVLLSVGLLVTDQREQRLDQFRAALSVLVYPVQWLVNAPSDLLAWSREHLASRQQLQERNAQLETENRQLLLRLQRLAALEMENARLRNLMESARTLHESVLVAEILRIDLDPYRHQILINRGKRDEVYPGQPLLDAFGVMGQVTTVGEFTAHAMLITDPGHALPVAVNRNGLRTIAVGTGDLNRLSLPYLPNSADIREGDLLITSGLGGRFPAGYPVAEVVTIARDPGSPFAQIEARPLAHLNRSREVLLVTRSSSSAMQLPPPAADSAISPAPELAR